MKVEEPLCRRVELYLSGLNNSITCWMNDFEIQSFNQVKLDEFDFFRVKPSPFTLVEFQTRCFQEIKTTDEVRHKMSPVVVKTYYSIQGGIRPKIINDALIWVRTLQKIQAIAYYIDSDNSLKKRDLSLSYDVSTLYLTSLSLLEDICFEPVNDESLISSKDLIFVEYLF